MPPRHLPMWLALSLPLLAACSPLWARNAPSETMMVPMADGVKLATEVYLPAGEGPFPVLLLRSTYGRTMDFKRYLDAGYGVVAQDIRGMGDSEGEKFVFRAEGWQPGLEDGRDTVDWVLAQNWCNGKIATYGGSALTMTQMLLAPTTDRVAAQVLEVGPGNFFREAFYNGGVFRASLAEGWLPMVGMEHLVSIYRAHPFEDGFWSYYNTTSRANEMTAPGLFITGWHDIFQQGAIDAFTSRELYGGPGARGRNHLIVKWSPHGPDTTPDYGWNENRFDLRISEIKDRFLRAHLTEDARALSRVPKVHYYVIGSDADPKAPGNEWRTADAWPPYPTGEQAWFLREDGVLSSDGPAREAASASFTYDPADPFPTLGGANLLPHVPSGPYDQRKVTEGRDDYLAFVSPPLEAPLEVTGRITVQLSVSSDAPDTDFTAKLLDIYPEGDDRELLVLDNIRRAATREGLDRPAPPLQGEDHIVRLEIDLWSIAWVFNTGHRIGLHVSSSNAPRYAANPNTYEGYLDPETVPQAARNTVHFGAAHPSMLFLPVRTAEADKD